MRRTEVWKRPRIGKRVREGGAAVQNSRIPIPAGLSRSARRAAMTTGAPGPFHGIAGLDRNRRREEKEATVANRDHRGEIGCQNASGRGLRGANQGRGYAVACLARGVLLPQCAGHHLKSEKQQSEKKYAPAEACGDGGGRQFIHLGFVPLFSFRRFTRASVDKAGSIHALKRVGII